MAVASRGSGPAEQERRTEWLALAARAVRADAAAREERAATKERDRPGANRMSGRTELMEHAIGSRSLARVEASTRTRPAVRVADRPATRPAGRTTTRTEVLERTRSTPAFYVVVLVLGSLYGLAMAAVTAVAIARFVLTDPLGAVGPVAFIGVTLGLVALAAVILPSAARSRRD